MLSAHGVKIAPSTYYAARDRAPSARACRDELVGVEIRRVHAASGGRYGARKVYHQLRREAVLVEGRPVARCTVERLMATAGLAVVHRGRRGAYHPAGYRRRPTAGPGETRLHRVRAQPAVDGGFHLRRDLVGFVYVAFAIDVFSRMIVGWRAARTMATELPLDALDMAATRPRW